MNQAEAQEAADRIRILREEFGKDGLRAALALTPDQVERFDRWAQASLAALAGQFDVDTTVTQERLSRGMKIASTLGALAICAAVVLFFTRFWGYLDTWAQVVVVMVAPLLALAGTEFAARRERTLYFAGLLALVSVTSFVMNIAVLGQIFNITSTENALLAWALFSLFVAYRYGLRFVLALGLTFLLSYGSATLTAHLGYRWLEFAERPEHFTAMGAIVFCVPFCIAHLKRTDFPAVYRVVGTLAILLGFLALAEWGAHSYLTFDSKTVERIYEFAGLAASAAFIWLGILCAWGGIVNTGAIFFAIFLFGRLYHWWWDWMPKYLFFAAIGAIGIALVAGFRHMRNQRAHTATAHTATGGQAA
jgi:uncharacterized membrane protein